jgi:Plasmid pRiA4b ORF-3-like protein
VDYLFAIRLVASKKPTIMRILLVPSTFTFKQFSSVIEIAFGWTGYHAHVFTVNKVLKEGEVRPFFYPAISSFFFFSILAAMDYGVRLMTLIRRGL